MILLASLMTAVAAYLGAGLLVGCAPRAGFRRASKPDLSQRQLWLIQAGSDLTTWQFMAGSGAIGLVVLALATLMTGVWWLAFMPAVGAALLPQVYYTRRRADRIRQLRRAWPDALRDALAAITAGSTLVLALYDLAERGPAPLRPAFGRFRLVSRMMGVVPALELVKEELADSTSDRVIEVLVLAYQHGGGLITEVLRDLVGEITEDLRLEADIRSDGTEQRIESRIVLIIPWLLLLFLTATSDQYRAYYHSANGLLVVTAAVVWSLFGVLLMKRISRRVEERRVLVRSSPEPEQGDGW